MVKFTFKLFFLAFVLLISVHSAKAQCVTIYDTISQTICAGDTFYFNGIPRTRSTGFRLPSDTVLLSGGCDSITFLRLTVLRQAKDSFNQSICSGTSYNFNGQLLRSTGIYKDTLHRASAYGCDSIVTINLTVGGAVTNNIAAKICYGDSFLFGGAYLKAAGVYTDTVVGGVACDSIVVLSLTYNTMPTTTITQQYCQGSSYTLNGQVITAPGTYRDTIFGGASNGCDSIVRLNYYPTVVRVTRRDTICFSDTLFIPGGLFILGSNGPGRYAPDTVLFGCVDSVFSYIIRVDTPATPTISASGLLLTEALTGFSSYQWQLAGANISSAIGASYTATQNGSYTVLVADARGCSNISTPYNITGVGIIGVVGDPTLRLYPSPNAGSFILETKDALGSEILIYNVLGSLLSRSTVTGDRTNMNIDMTDGVYVLKVKNSKGAETSVKFTVVK